MRARRCIAQMADLLAVEMDRAVVHGDQPDDHVEAGRLAGAVRPEQADDFSARHLERYVLDDDARAVAFLEAVDAQLAHRVSPGTRASFSAPRRARRARRRRFFGHDGRAHATFAIRSGPRRRDFTVKPLRPRVVRYEISANIVAAVAAQPRIVEEFDAVGLVVVFDSHRLPVDVSSAAFLLVPERRGIAGRDAVLKALAVLSNDDSLGADDERALRQHHLALEGRGFLGLVGGHAVRFYVHRLVAIGPLGERRRGCERPHRRERQRRRRRLLSRRAHRTCL